MKFEERKVLPKDGRACGLFRSAQRYDARKHYDGPFHDELLMHRDL